MYKSGTIGFGQTKFCSNTSSSVSSDLASAPGHFSGSFVYGGPE